MNEQTREARWPGVGPNVRQDHSQRLMELERGLEISTGLRRGQGLGSSGPKVRE